MSEKPVKNLVSKSLCADGKEQPKSTGRSNCTIFLDHPELLYAYELKAPSMAAKVEVPAYLRRTVKVKFK